MKNTYGDADAKDSAEILLEKEIAALRVEIAELVALLNKIHNTAPAGSSAISGWLDARVELRQTLEKYNP